MVQAQDKRCTIPNFDALLNEIIMYSIESKSLIENTQFSSHIKKHSNGNKKIVLNNTNYEIY